MLCVNCFDPAHLPFGDARTSQLGSAAQTGPGAAQAAAEQRFPPAGGAPHSKALKRLGYDGRRPPSARPAGRVGRDPVAGGPTRTHVPLRRLGEGERGEGCSEGNHLPSQNVSGQQAHHYQHVPSPPPGATRALVEDTFTSEAWGLVVGVACWPDTFWLGRWLPSLQPPPFPLSSSRLSGT